MRQWIDEHIIYPLWNLRNRKYLKADHAVWHAVEKHKDSLMCGQVSQIAGDVLDALVDAQVVR